MASGATSHRTASPTTHVSMPITAGRRRPTASDIRPPMGAAIAPSAEMPSNTMPLVWAFPAWSSSTSSGTRTRVPWRITVAPNTPTTAAENDREANSFGSTAGCSVRRSISTKIARSRAAAATARSGEPPLSSSRSPRSSDIRNPARRPSPGRSIGRGVPRIFTALGRASAPTATAASSATGTATMKIHRQPRPATRRPPTSGPTAALVDTSMSNNPNAEPRRSGGAISRSSATELVETSAPVTAWSTRDSASSSKDMAVAASAEASAKAPTPKRNTRRWPNRSPRLPLAGSAIATAPRYSVTREATVAAPTPNSSITLGSATASIVELRGTRIAPDASPSIAPVIRRA